MDRNDYSDVVEVVVTGNPDTVNIFLSRGWEIAHISKEMVLFILVRREKSDEK